LLPDILKLVCQAQAGGRRGFCAVHGTGGPVELVGEGLQGWVTVSSLSTPVTRWLRVFCAAIVHKSTGRATPAGSTNAEAGPLLVLQKCDGIASTTQAVGIV